jgi:hypothetical protein
MKGNDRGRRGTMGNRMRTDSGTTKGSGWKEVNAGNFKGNRRVDLTKSSAEFWFDGQLQGDRSVGAL